MVLSGSFGSKEKNMATVKRGHEASDTAADPRSRFSG
jgi:hypothetical protein